MDIEGYKNFHGELSDRYGKSQIKGILNKTRLEFTKDYEVDKETQPIEYEFRLKNGVWMGEWSKKAGDRGRAVCQLHEGFSLYGTDSMKKTGWLGYLCQLINDKG